jgi:voltage-gated potassium channel
MWWSVCTVTTVVYGDVYPITTLGRIAGGIVAITGIAAFALPTAILGAGFLEELESKKQQNQTLYRCPQCGHVDGDSTVKE